MTSDSDVKIDLRAGFMFVKPMHVYVSKTHVSRCYVEAASEFNFTSLADPTILEKMWKSSPIQYAEKVRS